MMLLAIWSAPASADTVPKLTWADCEGGFECAKAAVPLDHGRPDGTKIDLALIRKPATDSSARIGSLFLNPGGPGGSTFDFVRAAAEFAAPLNDRFDLVGWDPRGTGLSGLAVDCDVDPEVLGPYAQPFPRPFTEAEATLPARTRQYIDRCLSRNDRRGLRYLSTGNSARDLDLLRRAVGDSKLSYLGLSYGTAIGATYASLFPGSSRALVLDGALDDGWWRRYLETTREQTSGFERALGRFLEACAADQTACSGFGGSDPRRALDELLQRLDAQPLEAPAFPGRPVDGDDVRWTISTITYSKGLWGLGAAALAQAAAGDGDLLREMADAFYGREPDGGADPATDQFVAVTGLDVLQEGGPERYIRAGRHSYRLFDHFWWNSGYGDMPFGLWPVTPNGAYRDDYSNPSSAQTALVIGTTYDPATPYRWAESLTRQLGNARLLTMRGDGHTAFGGNSPCIDAAVEAYLEEHTLPEAGTVCDQDLPFTDPFADPGTARSTQDTTTEAILDRLLPRIKRLG
jgi:pimeloyl-ACP methyl ester carboxylesterase